MKLNESSLDFPPKVLRFISLFFYSCAVYMQTEIDLFGFVLLIKLSTNLVIIHDISILIKVRFIRCH